jgi:hypothetical protein
MIREKFIIDFHGQCVAMVVITAEKLATTVEISDLFCDQVQRNLFTTFAFLDKLNQLFCVHLFEFDHIICLYRHFFKHLHIKLNAFNFPGNEQLVCLVSQIAEPVD